MTVIYSDSGLLVETGHIPNIDSWGGTASASTSNPGLAAQTSGGVTGVQNSYMLDASIPLNTYFGWGITLDKNNSSYGLNMSAYASGHIKFYLMTDRALAGGEEIYVNVKDSGGNACTNIVIGPSYGWTNTVIGSWAPISVPVSAITGASISSINLPFIIDIHNLSGSSPITMSVDYVQWTTN